MSRRDDRDSHAKRHYSNHSLPQRDRSPKRSRRDGKPATERTQHLETDGATGQEHKNRRRLQDALPLELSVPPDSKVNQDIPAQDSDKKADVVKAAIKHASDPKEVPRSESYFQHDDRGTAGQGRSHSHRTSDYGRWSDPKDHSGGQVKDKSETADLQKKDGRTRTYGDDSRSWKHDGFFELDADAPPTRKRPPFTEEKPVKTESAAGTGIQPKDHDDQLVQGAPRREEKRSYHSRGVDNPEKKSFSHPDERNGRTERFPERNDMHRSGYHSRNRYGGRSVRGREDSGRRYGESSGRYGDRGTNQRGQFQVEKWKHDLFDSTNKSPSPRNEEEQIAKIEALLAS